MWVPEKGIPRELLARAEAIAVFPGVVKAAFIFGGRTGQGIISRRTSQGWSEPAFFNIGGGSFGPQIGVNHTDYVLLIMNDNGLKGLLEDKFEFGGEASFAASPIGRSASATTNATLDAVILSYSRSQGAFIGASLKGAVFGLVLYLVNFYGFTTAFPWFAMARGPITIITHIIFGVAAAWAYKGLAKSYVAAS
jgi:lipid-binding SYLF domain-containing protein